MSETKPLRFFGLIVGGVFTCIGGWPARVSLSPLDDRG
jgi:hypothetical protein